MFRRTALAVTATALAIGGAAIVLPTGASAASPEALAGVANTDTAASSSGSGSGEKTRHHRRLTEAERQTLRTTGHLTLTRNTNKHGTVTVLVQRGEVMSVTPTSIELRSKDGFTHSYVITPKTTVREKGQPIPLSDLKIGERAMVIALQTKDGDIARRIGCLRAAKAHA